MDQHQFAGQLDEIGVDGRLNRIDLEIKLEQRFGLGGRPVVKELVKIHGRRPVRQGEDRNRADAQAVDVRTLRNDLLGCRRRRTRQGPGDGERPEKRKGNGGAPYSGHGDVLDLRVRH